MSTDPATAPICPSCGERGTTGDKWCEACGADFAGEFESVVGPACVECGAPHSEIFDGYCSECGRKQPAERDHLCVVVGDAAGVTDRGKRHHHNEDHFALGVVGATTISVVCDGVSSTNAPEEASLLAANAARDSVVAALESGGVDYEAMIVEAIGRAQDAAAGVDRDDSSSDPASTTIVATIVVPDLNEPSIVRTWTGWLGDSRSYWCYQPVDDPEAGFVVTQLMTDDVIGASISRWLGADAADTAPSVQVFEHDAGTPDRAAMLLSCSDGLWRYVNEPGQLAALLDTFAAEHDSAVQLATALVEFANEQGGHDNTTVVVVPI